MEESTLFDSEGSNFQITNNNFDSETYISGERLNDKETKTIDSKKQRKTASSWKTTTFTSLSKNL
jgi:hypothetical protein